MMRRTLQFVKFWFAVLFMLSAARAASAQAMGVGQDAPRLDVFIGYSYVRANSVATGALINMNGGSASVAFNFDKWIGLVGDVGVYHQASVTANNLSLTVSSYQAGPRFTLRRHDHLIPFAQVLAGAGHATGTLYTTSLGGGSAPIGTNNAFMLTAGGGIDWKLTPTVGIRLIQAEYLYSQFLNGGTYVNRQNNVRLSAGIVFSFYKR
jgi:outer membrane immunogenic protein